MGATLLKPILHICNLLQVDGPTLLDADNGILYLFQTREFSQGTDKPLPSTRLKPPPWKRKIFCLEDFDQGINREADRAELLSLYLHLDLPLQASPYINGCHSFNLFEIILNPVVCQISQLGFMQWTSQGNNEDRAV